MLQNVRYPFLIQIQSYDQGPFIESYRVVNKLQVLHFGIS